VADVSLDQALPVFRSLAAGKASAFVRRCRLAIDEREDIESQLILILIRRWPQFDGRKASPRTFASRVMDKELTSILRCRLASKRQACGIPTQNAGPNQASVEQFRVDAERAMAALPRIVRETASALSSHSAIDVAEVVGCSRQMVNRRKHKIHDALLAMGIGPDYFAQKGRSS
jgi:DNA-directed RNA polymerase specialized sigma24 family protein